MAKFKKAIKDNEDVYLVTHENAVIDNDGTTIPEKYATKEEIDGFLSEDNLNVTEFKYNTNLRTTNGICEFNSNIDGYIDNIYIEGETLTNLVSVSEIVTNSSGEFVVMLGVEPHYDKITDGTYTLFNCDKRTIWYEIADKGGYNNYNNICVEPYSSTVITIGSNQRLYSYFCRPSDGWDTAEKASTARAMVIKGNHVGRRIRYFKGIESIGSNGQISLLNISTDCEKINLDNVTYVDGFIPEGASEPNGIYGHKTIQEYIEVEEGVEYLIEHCNNVAYYDANKNLIYSSIELRLASMPAPYYEPGIYHTFISVVRIPKNVKYIRVSTGLKSVGLITIYKNAKYDKQRIYVNLRSTYNNVSRDNLYKQGLKYIKNSKCSEFNIDGHWEYITHVETLSQTIKFGIANLAYESGILYGYGNIWTADGQIEYFPYKYELGDYEHVYLEGDGKLYININKSRLGSLDVAGMHAFLQGHPLKLVATSPNNNHRVEFDTDYSVKTFKGNNKLYVCSGHISGDCSFDITTNIADTLNVLKNKVSVNEGSSKLDRMHTLEIGNNIDFHNKNDMEYMQGHRNDFSTRLYAQTTRDVSIALPSKTGTLALYNDVQGYKIYSDSGNCILQDGGHFNDILKSGVYNCIRVSGYPWSPYFGLDTWWFLEVFTHSYAPSHVYQRITSMVGYNWTFDRKKEGSWSEWRCINPPMFGTQAPTVNYNINCNGLIYIQY